jgi:hypothetical protein
VGSSVGSSEGSSGGSEGSEVRRSGRQADRITIGGPITKYQNKQLFTNYMKITTHSKQTLGYEDLQKLAKHQKWTIRTLLFLLVIICTGIAWIVAYKAAEGFWLKNIVISAVQPGIRQAKAAELTIEEYICTKQWDCKTDR